MWNMTALSHFSLSFVRWVILTGYLHAKRLKNKDWKDTQTHRYRDTQLGAYFLQPAYISCGKVIFQCCLSACSWGSSVTSPYLTGAPLPQRYPTRWDSLPHGDPLIHGDPSAWEHPYHMATPYYMDLFKPVHLGSPWPTTLTCSNLFTWDPLVTWGHLLTRGHLTLYWKVFLLHLGVYSLVLRFKDNAIVRNAIFQLWGEITFK